MRTDNKKSLIVLREKHQVERYIREMTEQDVSVKIVIDDTIVLEDCRFIPRQGKKKDLLIEAPLAPGDYPETGRARITCAGASSLYAFTSRVLSIEFAEHRRMHLAIQFPDRITKQERRKDVRVQPSGPHPLVARIVVSNDGVIDVETVDISGGGMSFMITEEVSRFKSGDTLELDISVPALGGLRARATVRNVIHLMDLTRIGVEFSLLSDDARRTIMEYVAKREAQMQEEALPDE